MSSLYMVLVPSELVRPRKILLACDMGLTTAVVKLDSIGWERSRQVSYETLVVVEKYEVGLLPSGSGVAGKVLGRFIFRAR